MLTWTFIFIWLLLGAWAWWIYFRGGVKTLRTETWGFVTLASIMLVITFACTIWTGPLACALLIEGEPKWE